MKFSADDYSDKDLERMQKFSSQLEHIATSCSNLEEVMIFSTVMLEYARVGLGMACRSQELGNSLMFDYINRKSTIVPKHVI